LVYSALIGQTTQSVVIDLLCSDWSDGSVCCDWSTLLWLVRWLSLLWLVYSALIGQMAQSLIGLLCSDWSNGSVFDWSTLLWLVNENASKWVCFCRAENSVFSTWTTQTKLLSSQQLQCLRLKVDVVHRLPMKTTGWHYANFLHCYIGKPEVRLELLMTSFSNSD